MIMKKPMKKTMKQAKTIKTTKPKKAKKDLINVNSTQLTRALFALNWKKQFVCHVVTCAYASHVVLN